MRREQGLGGESARAKGAAVGPLASVVPQMRLQVILADEGLVTEGTPVRPLACVDDHVTLEVVFAEEPLSTLRAAVWFDHVLSIGRGTTSSGCLIGGVVLAVGE